jgi:hypothetical protein
MLSALIKALAVMQLMALPSIRAVRVLNHLPQPSAGNQLWLGGRGSK